MPQEMYLGKYREEWVEIAATKPHRSAKWFEKGTEAMQNGVSRETFKQRLWRGHDIEDAASTPHRSVDMKYMLMRNDVIVSVGTIDEIAQERGVKRESIAYMISPSYHKRIRTNRAQRLVPFDAAY